MSTKALQSEYLTDTADLFRKARGLIVNGIPRLYKIREEELWEGRTSTFNEYVEDVCGLDMGQVSRWLTVWKYYVVEGPLEPAQLNAVNPEKLYVARKLEGTPEEQYSKALTLSKSDLRAQGAEEDGHTCEAIEVCSHCWKRM